MNKSDSITNLAAAIVKMQLEVKHAKKDSKNPFFKSNYADLQSVWEADHEALERNGLAIIQLYLPADGNYVKLETILMHSSGEWLSGTACAPLVKADPQSYGSATTYLRRYSRMAITGVIPEDDDAESAMREKNPTNRTIPAKTPPRELPVEEVQVPVEKITKAKKQDGTFEFCIHAGEKYYTGSEKLALVAKQAMEMQIFADITYLDKPSGREAMNVTLLKEPGADTDI